MHELGFELLDGHMLLEVGGRRVLLDTGAPQSFGGGLLALPWRDGPVELPETHDGLTVGQAREEIAAAAGVAMERVAFDAFLGCDLLAGMRLVIDWAVGRLAAGPAAPERPVNDRRFGLPLAVVRIGHRAVPAFLDTGARLSYARAELLEGCPRGPLRRDFARTWGGFERVLVQTRRADVTWGTFTLGAELGEAAGPVLLLLEPTGVGAVIGSDLMSRCGTTTLDL